MSMTLPSKHRKHGRDLALRHPANHTATLPLPAKTRSKSTSPLPKPDSNMNIPSQPQKMLPSSDEIEGKLV